MLLPYEDFRSAVFAWADENEERFRLFWPLQGGWEHWVQAEVAAYIINENSASEILREQPIYNNGQVADWLLNEQTGGQRADCGRVEMPARERPERAKLCPGHYERHSQAQWQHPTRGSARSIGRDLSTARAQCKLETCCNRDSPCRTFACSTRTPQSSWPIRELTFRSARLLKPPGMPKPRGSSPSAALFLLNTNTEVRLVWCLRNCFGAERLSLQKETRRFCLSSCS